MENINNTKNRILDELDYNIGCILKTYMYDYISQYKFREIICEVEYVLKYMLLNNRNWIYRFDYIIDDSRIDEYIVHFIVDTDYTDTDKKCFLTSQKYTFSLYYNDYDYSLNFKRIK